MDDNPSILSHVSIGTNDFERAVAFRYSVDSSSCHLEKLRL
jgi:hypothetical protein